MERTIVQTAEYTLDVADARSTDSAPHRFDWLYHNFGTESSDLPLQPYSELPKTNGYQHLTKTVATSSGEPWQTTFAQPGSNLRLYMLSAPETRVVSGEGLGPDLRFPVPFVMARREAAQTRFSALYEPYSNSPAITSFHGSGNTYSISTATFTDELSLEPGNFTLLRKASGRPLRLIETGKRLSGVAGDRATRAGRSGLFSRWEECRNQYDASHGWDGSCPRARSGWYPSERDIDRRPARWRIS
jgi:hypothetical protein